jgi:hypothetical protein
MQLAHLFIEVARLVPHLKPLPLCFDATCPCIVFEEGKEISINERIASSLNAGTYRRWVLLAYRTGPPLLSLIIFS